MARRINDLPRWLLIALWLLGNLAMFLYTYCKYANSKEFFYLKKILGDALPWARASAACLNLNCMMVLFPMCRNLLSFLRGSLKRCCTKTVRRQLDKHITFHKYIAYMICLHTAVHISAHVFNVECMFVAHSGSNGLQAALSNLSDLNAGQTAVNPVRDASKCTFCIESLCKVLFAVKTIAGTSGLVATIALILILSSSFEIIRRSYFEVFWFTHHLFVIFFIGIIIHGIGADRPMWRTMTLSTVPAAMMCGAPPRNYAVPYPSLLAVHLRSVADHVCCVADLAVGGGPPLLLYLLERLVRFIRARQQVVITKVVRHSSNVFELQMKKRGFTMAPGQYIFLHCPKLSFFEWHPFTLTSAPEDDFFSVHIRRVGNWTNALAKECHVDELEFKEAWKLPRVAVDGPFGTATEDIFSYEVDVFVAAGIGVTPFASVLKLLIWYRKQLVDGDIKLKHVYFYWICKEIGAFEWLHDLLLFYDKQMTDEDHKDFLKYFVFLTRGWDTSMAKNIVKHDEDTCDSVTGLHQKTHFGRPNWDIILPKIALDHVGKKIGGVRLWWAKRIVKHAS